MAKITITADAAGRLGELQERVGEVAFKLDNGCCGGTTLLLIERMYLGGEDVQIARVCGVDVYAERPFARLYEGDHYHIYARDGVRDGGFSAEIPYGFKFLMTRQVLPASSERARAEQEKGVWCEH